MNRNCLRQGQRSCWPSPLEEGEVNSSIEEARRLNFSAETDGVTDGVDVKRQIFIINIILGDTHSNSYHYTSNIRVMRTFSAKRIQRRRNDNSRFDDRVLCRRLTRVAKTKSCSPRAMGFDKTPHLTDHAAKLISRLDLCHLRLVHCLTAHSAATSFHPCFALPRSLLPLCPSVLAPTPPYSHECEHVL